MNPKYEGIRRAIDEFMDVTLGYIPRDHVCILMNSHEYQLMVEEVKHLEETGLIAKAKIEKPTLFGCEVRIRNYLPDGEFVIRDKTIMDRYS
ncbi:MAG: hypothetical protein IKO38_07240 [Erysipelotrichaceae bacterium]|nr:hypothetical protein [Erysipelotrichaceae bacterium]